MPIVAFTGHRPNAFPYSGGPYSEENPYRWAIIQAIEEMLDQLKPELAISGMALGVDTWAVLACMSKGVPFRAAVPFKGQELRWPEPSQRLYQHLLQKARDVVYVCEPGYSPKKMQVRNEWICNQLTGKDDRLIAVYNGVGSGGTFNCIKYARGRKEYTEGSIINLWPRVQEIVVSIRKGLTI